MRAATRIQRGRSLRRAPRAALWLLLVAGVGTAAHMALSFDCGDTARSGACIPVVHPAGPIALGLVILSAVGVWGRQVVACIIAVVAAVPVVLWDPVAPWLLGACAFLLAVVAALAYENRFRVREPRPREASDAGAPKEPAEPEPETTL